MRPRDGKAEKEKELQRLRQLWRKFDYEQFAELCLDVDEVLRRTSMSLRKGFNFAHAFPGHGWCLVTEHVDRPEQLARLTSVLAGWDINIAGVLIRRNATREKMVVITLVDSEIPSDAVDELEGPDKKIRRIRSEFWEWTREDVGNDLDLSAFPEGWDSEGSALVARTAERPGQLAKATRALERNGVSCRGFLVYREKEGKPGQPGLLATLLDREETVAQRSGQSRLISEFKSAFGDGLSYQSINLSGLGKPVELMT